MARKAKSTATVRPLEWRVESDTSVYAFGIFDSRYILHGFKDSWCIEAPVLDSGKPPKCSIGVFPDLQSAKDAADGDYRTRVLAALE